MRRVLTLSGAMVSLLLILPLMPLLIWSFAHGWRFPALWPQGFSLRAWSFALSPSAGVGAALLETAFIALWVGLLSVALGLPVARWLAQGPFRAKAWLVVLILLPLILPPFASIMGLHGLFTRLHLAGTRLGVVLAHLIPALPYAILILWAQFARLDPGYEAQARSLGAGPWRAFALVTLPIIAPGVMLALALTFLVSWGQYALTLMIGGGRVETLPLLLFSTVAAGRNDLTGALAMIYILPGLLFLALTVRR